MKNRDVLISGAGIAGPALAYWLSEYGFTATVVERAPALRTGGQTVDLRGAGRTVIERMGLMDRVREVSVGQRGIAFVGAGGQVAARMPTELFGGEGIVSDVEVLRGDLGQVLHTAALPGAEYLFDDTVRGLDQDDDGVTVTFEKARSRRFDLVIGADGLNSAVRGLAFGPGSRYLRPLGCYTAWFTAPAEFDLDGWFLMHNAPGGLAASIRPGRVPGEVKAGLSFRSAPVGYDPRDTASQMDILASRFSGAGWEIPRLVKAMRTAPDFFFEPVSQVRLDRWSSGRVTLVGDAGYCPTPLTGLGTSLALVGAYVLAGELAAADGDHHVAFARYEQVTRPYVTRGQRQPQGGIRGFAPHSAFGIGLRTASMRWMSRWPLRNLLAGQFAKAAGIELPDYKETASTMIGSQSKQHC